MIIQFVHATSGGLAENLWGITFIAKYISSINPKI